MNALIDGALGSIEGAGGETAVLFAVAYVVLRWLCLGVRADLARLRAAGRGRGGVRDAHDEAFERGMKRLLAECDVRPAAEPTLRRAA